MKKQISVGSENDTEKDAVATRVLHQPPTQSTAADTSTFTAIDTSAPTATDTLAGLGAKNLVTTGAVVLGQKGKSNGLPQHVSLTEPHFPSTHSILFSSTPNTITNSALGSQIAHHGAYTQTFKFPPSSYRALPKPDQSPPDSSIADLWQEVLLYRFTGTVLPSTTASSITSQTTKESAIIFQHARVEYDVREEPFNDSDIKHIREYLGSSGIELSIGEMMGDAANISAGEFQTGLSGGTLALMVQVKARFFPDSRINIKSTEFALPPPQNDKNVWSEDAELWRTAVSRNADFESVQPRLHEPPLSQMQILPNISTEPVISIRFGLDMKKSFDGSIPQHDFRLFKVPSWDVKDNTCAYFLSALFGDDVFKDWVKVASKTLGDLLTARLDDQGEPKASYAGNLRQYGYLTSASNVAIWEITVKLQPSVGANKAIGGNDAHSVGQPANIDAQRHSRLPRPIKKATDKKATDNQAAHGQASGVRPPTTVPQSSHKPNPPMEKGTQSGREGKSTARKSSRMLEQWSQNPATRFSPRLNIRQLASIDLKNAEDILRFDRYHRAILEWGLGRYCRSYVQNLCGVFWEPTDEFMGVMSHEKAREFWDEVVHFD